MKLTVSYLVIPVIFAFLVASYAITTGKHNQANFLSLFTYGFLFYGVPYFLFGFLVFLLKPSKFIVHSGFIGISIALLLIASIWLLPPDSSGLPIQWMGYYPLSIVFCLVFMGSTIVYSKLKNS